MTMYHYHYAAVVWNKEDFSDLSILRKRTYLRANIMLFNSENDAKTEATRKGFKNCETVSLFHSRM